MEKKIIHLFGKPKAPSPAAKKRPYQVSNVIKDHGSRYDAFTLYYEDGLYREVVKYNYVIRFHAADTAMQIKSIDGVHCIIGRHLERLLPALQAQQIEFLTAYCEDLHLPPAPDEVYIKEMSFMTDREWDEFTRRRQQEQARMRVPPRLARKRTLRNGPIYGQGVDPKHIRHTK